MTANRFSRGSRSRRAAGLTGLLVGVGLLVAVRAASGQTTVHRLALPPAVPPPVAAAPTTSGPAAPTSSGAAPAAPAPAAGLRTVNGDVVDTPYGPVQVAVVFNGTRITDVRTLQTPTDANRSIRLASLATPILRQEVLSAQSASVDSVSGATYTSEGYAQSVQYAIDHSRG